MGDKGTGGNCQTMQPRVAIPSSRTQEAENIDEQVTGAHLQNSSIARHPGTMSSKDLPLGDKQVSGKERQSVNPDNSSRDGHSGDEVLDGIHQVLGKVVTDISQPAAKVSSSTNEGCSEGSEPEVVNVHQLRTASQFTMAIQVGDRPVKAVVDSAAEVTIVSGKVYETLKHPPKKLREVTLLAAGRQMAMKGFVVGPVRLQIVTQWYSKNVYIAPIEQDMLLGFDILFHRGKSVLNMAKGTLTFDDQEIALTWEARMAPHM